MTTQAEFSLEHRSIPWLWSVALATTLPHVPQLPLWLSAFCALVLGLAVWRWRRELDPLERWTLLLIVVAAIAGIALHYRSLFGREVGIALLITMMMLKQLELRSQRDAQVCIVLGCFLLLTHYFDSQEILTGIWLLACIWLIVASLIRLSGGPEQSARSIWRQAAALALQAIPLMLVLYLLFPRISGPLWGLPGDAHSGRTGLSETMSPGMIANLVQNGEVAFRVRFDGEVPPAAKLYWRGPVLENYDGKTWRPAASNAGPLNLAPLGSEIAYEMTLEPHRQRWLLALDAPIRLPADSAVDAALTVKTSEPVNSLQRFRLTAALDYRHNVTELPGVRRRNLTLPANGNLRSRELAAQWRQQNSDPQTIVREALSLFNREFVYTLQPPLLGSDPIDDFLFRSRRGFCEHYATAFVFLMRAAGVPARVVTGYQGGERNPLDNYLVVRQSDAHAWAEIWLANRGWVRIDPTSAVAPERIEQGIASALLGSNLLPAVVSFRGEWLLAVRYRWEAINNAWNQYVLGYDEQQQRQLLTRFGWPDADWRTLVGLLALACTLILGLIAGQLMFRRPAGDPASRLWQKSLRRIARRQVHFAVWETPDAICQHVMEQAPDLAPLFQRVTRAYLQVRYASDTEHLSELRAAVAQLP